MGRRSVVVVVAAVLLLSGSAGYRGASSGPQAPRVQGTAESVDDVGLRADRRPMDDERLLVVPARDADLLWHALGARPKTGQLAWATGIVPAGSIDSARVVEIRRGRFEVEVSEGEYLACLLAESAQPYVVRGCARAVVIGATTWRVSTGEAGFTVSTGRDP